MPIIINIILITLISFKLLIAEEKKCPELENNISVHLISDGFYKYDEYLHYSLGKFSSERKKIYNLNVANELDLIGVGSDIIFGEYNELKKLPTNKKKLITPKIIKDFFIKNEIKNTEEINNIYPLDLDTFILISNKDTIDITHEEDIHKFINPNKYTLSQSFYSKSDTIKFFNYLLMDNHMDFKNPFFESILFNQKKKYYLMNKNTFLGKYEEVIDSFNNNENLYTLFTDGYAYKENLNYIQYPNSKLIWDADFGKFNVSEAKNTRSFFGFSALVNKKNGYSFLCFITKKESRNDLLKKFDLGISPLSINDIIEQENISTQYKKLLTLKNQNIKKIETNNSLDNQQNFHQSIIKLIIGQDDTLLTNQEINYFKEKN